MAYLNLADRRKCEEFGLIATLHALALHDPKKLHAMIKDLTEGGP